MYVSQLGQDKFIDEYFQQQTNLVFLDVGAHDGITLSNTYFLEKHRLWSGLCIEPQPSEFEKLRDNRNCICLNTAVSIYDGEIDFTYVDGYANMLSGISQNYNQAHKDRIVREVNEHGGSINTIKVPAKRLQSILDQYLLYNIDFCSIDTEGSEFDIVQSIDFEKTKIKIFIIENNYQDSSIQQFLTNYGYVLHSKLQWDDIFIHPNI